VGFHHLEKPSNYIPYLTPSWVLSARQFLGNNNMHLQVSDLHIDKLKSPTDEYIMQSQHLQWYTSIQQYNLNLVKIWLQVSTLADMSDPDRLKCIRLSYLDAERPKDFIHSTAWPRQASPTKTQKRLWKRFIGSLYLRYTPYWKIPPISTLPDHPEVSQRSICFSDIKSQTLSLSSKTERRLLDGFQQQASDLQVWRASRSKRRLHLASDGGLSNTSATHGWTLSTGTQVVLICSRPVDGPSDTNSPTLRELGGCASALLLLSILTDFWGLKHRCSFNVK
jgi:hypothetical protein